MKSPFPGMDPFIEARGLWTDFHDNLIVELQATLNAQLPSRYEALLGERTFVDVVDTNDDLRQEMLIKPDVRVDVRPGLVDEMPIPSKNDSGIATSILMHPRVETEEREAFIEIREIDNEDRVVTCIEILSPTNKRPGTPGWGEYERKRQLMFQGISNFIEIDLLRGGRRRPMCEPWPNSPYYVLIMRLEEAPLCHVHPAYTTIPLPTFPIPLAPPDPDLPCNLQTIVNAVLARTRYERRLRYGESIEPPLSAAERRFLQIAN